MRVSIIAEGGAMRSAYVVGAIDALYSHYGLKKLSVVTGTSGSAPTAAFYASGQFPACYKGWKEHVPSPHMLGFSNILRGRPYMDIDYLVDVIIRKLEGFSPTDLKRSPVQLVLPVTLYETGRVEFIDFNMSTLDVFEVLRAAMNIPVVYNKTVLLNGAAYFDSHLGDPLCLDNPYLSDSRKIILLTSPLDYAPSTKRKIEANLFRPLLAPVIYRALLDSPMKRRRGMKQCRELIRQGDIVIAPAYKKGRPFNNSSSNINFLIQQGYNDALANEPLRNFIDTLRASPRADFYFSTSTTV